MNYLSKLAAIAFAAASTCAAASVTFAYESAPLKNEEAFAPDEQWPSLKISAEFSDDGTELLSWKFEQANVGSLSSNGATGDVRWLSLTTDSTGAPTAWSLVAVQDEGELQLIFASYHNENFGVPAPGFERDAAQRYVWGDNPQRALFGLNSSGTWSSTAALPNMSFVLQVPEPTTQLMFAAGVACLIGFSRRTRQGRLAESCPTPTGESGIGR